MPAQRISPGEEHLLKAFLEGAGNSLDSFRYFEKRGLAVIKNHLCTWLWLEQGQPVAYGHLDLEDGITWLGIAVQASHRGQGHGKRMMKLLLDSARGSGVQQLKLSVDNKNRTAIKLYEAFGFSMLERNDRFAFYTCDLIPTREAIMSSLAFMGRSVEDMIATAERESMALEFSSGIPFHEQMEKLFLEAPVRRFAHNYFPAPKDPFVLNLGSLNEANRVRSIEHCVRGMEMSHTVGAPFFSAHAGYCVDPKPSELGRKLEQVEQVDREANWKHFITSVSEVLNRTRHMPTGFLIENNVLAPVNRYADGTNPLLCVDADEQLRLLADVPDPRLGLLFDTAHMKVSAGTLGFDLNAATHRVLPKARCVHHSDNEGSVDDNQQFGPGYWFRPFMGATSHALHVLETKKCTPSDLRRMEALLFSA